MKKNIRKTIIVISSILIIIALYWTIKSSINPNDVLYADHMLGEQNRILYSKDYITVYYTGIKEKDDLLENPGIKLLNSSDIKHTIVIRCIYINGKEIETNINVELLPNEYRDIKLEDVQKKAADLHFNKIREIGLYACDIPSIDSYKGFEAYLEI